MPHVFTTIWKKGSDHTMPDGLSRHPLDVPLEDDKETVVVLQCDVRQVVISAVTSIVDEQLMLHETLSWMVCGRTCATTLSISSSIGHYP